MGTTILAIYVAGLLPAYVAAMYLADKEMVHDRSITSKEYVNGVCMLMLFSWYTLYYTYKRLKVLDNE